MSWLRKRGKLGFSGVEILAVTGVIALLLTLGVMVHRSLRTAAQVTVAESNLKQISTGMELYFQKYNTYPPQGSDLVAELGPFVENPQAFNNPMVEESSPGETLNALYVAPTFDELDSPENYVTAMVSKNGKTVLMLKTGHRVERRDDLSFMPTDLNDALAAILNPTEGLPDNGGTTPPEQGIRGLINLNPRNNDDYEFWMQPVEGEWVTRDTLHASNGEYRCENLPVSVIVFCPKGNGNQNSLTVDGVPYPVRNGRLYYIVANMTVTLYNVSCNGNGSGGQNKSGNGKAMGRWWAEIVAPAGTVVDCGVYPGTSPDGM